MDHFLDKLETHDFQIILDDFYLLGLSDLGQLGRGIGLLLSQTHVSAKRPSGMRGAAKQTSVASPFMEARQHSKPQLSHTLLDVGGEMASGGNLDGTVEAMSHVPSLLWS